MTSPASGRSPPGIDGPSPERPRPGGARVWITGLAISALLHLAFVLLYPILMARITPEPTATAPPGRPVRPPGIEILSIAEVPDPSDPSVEAPDELREEPEPEPETPTPEPTPAEPAEPAGEPSAETPSAAEVLRAPEEGDARLWRPVDSALAELTDEQRAKLRILWRLEAMNDSSLTAAERARRARDWTYTDEEGKKWGVSPGKLHLGDVTVPLPAFSAPPTARDQLQAWLWEDVRRGAETSIIRDVWKERIEAIRERRDAERADTTGARP